jgi:hypothetical protein
MFKPKILHTNQHVLTLLITYSKTNNKKIQDKEHARPLHINNNELMKNLPTTIFTYLKIT